MIFTEHARKYEAPKVSYELSKFAVTFKIDHDLPGIPVTYNISLHPLIDKARPTYLFMNPHNKTFVRWKTCLSLLEMCSILNMGFGVNSNQ